MATSCWWNTHSVMDKCGTQCHSRVYSSPYLRCLQPAICKLRTRNWIQIPNNPPENRGLSSKCTSKIPRFPDGRVRTERRGGKLAFLRGSISTFSLMTSEHESVVSVGLKPKVHSTHRMIIWYTGFVLEDLKFHGHVLYGMWVVPWTVRRKETQSP